MINYQDFELVDIRVGTILKVDDFPEAKKPAFKLQIDFGREIGTKNSSVQITKHYKKEDLIGKQVVCVVNFPPKQIGPFVSEVLTLGLPDDSDGVILLSPITMAKIAFFEVKDWEKDYIKQGFSDNPEFETVFFSEKFDKTLLPKDTGIVSVFVGSNVKVGDTVSFENLKLITTRSTGFDHLEFQSLSEKGIKLGYVPGYGDNTVAEFAFGLLLSVCCFPFVERFLMRTTESKRVEISQLMVLKVSIWPAKLSASLVPAGSVSK
ncbi:MAG: Methionyl-tRNA synthetase [Parcubacteria group bacterium GW2011_GWB1_41_4]|nr:MAG: Methionyl-tRNA synthetase [Parcubacteria group bacterium GW2011_GWB1_41_4]